MTIILTGGGSGGHITPILAVAEAIKRAQPDTRLVYIGFTGDKLADVPRQSPYIDEVRQVRAGKFRRYHGEGWRQLLDVPTLLKNVRDAWFTLIGTWQSYRLLGKLKPEAVLLRGGFVGVPVGLAAAMRHIPYVTHDSDSIPSLANRIISRWARIHAVALPKDVYAYPPEKTVTVGVPISAAYQPVTKALQAQYRKELDIPATAPVICVTGGGLGAQRLNEAMVAAVPELLKHYPELRILHITGRDHETVIAQWYRTQLSDKKLEQVTIKGFVDDLYRYSGAADVVICRAGATNLAEFARQGKACLLVPNPYLTAGHQLKNARYIEQANAAVVLPEAALNQPVELVKQVSVLLASPARRMALGEALQTFAQPDAAGKLAELLVSLAGGQEPAT